MIKNMLDEIKKVSNLMGKDRNIFIVIYFIYFLIWSFAMYVLSASGCQYLLDGGLTGNWVLFKKGLYYIILLCLVVCIILPISRAINELLRYKLNMKLRDKIYDHLVKLPINFFDTHTSSEIIGLILNNLDGVNATIELFFSTVMECTVLGVIAIYSLIQKEFIIGIFIVMGLAGLTGVISLKFVEKIRRKSDKAQTKLGNTDFAISDLFSGICYEKIYDKGDVVYQDFQKNNHMYISAKKSVIAKNDMVEYTKNLIETINELIILITGIILMIKGNRTIGEVMAIVSISQVLYYETAKFFTLLQNSQWSLVCAGKIIDFLKEDEELNVNNQLNKIDFNSLIQFKNVSFQYKKGTTILNNLTFDIKSGEKVNLVGYSGNGKSTVIKLILGFYKNYQGSILIDGFEIKDTSNERLKRYISYVSQENLLFNSSIKDNIKYGNLYATEEDIIEVAKEVGLHDFIMSLPEKYNTIVSFGGSNFSQKQCTKMAIARAMVKKAPIIVLDEVMAKISPRDEVEIIQALDKLTKGKTVINIAHKLNSIAQDERIIVFERGEIVEDGIKQELLERESILKKYII